MAQPARIVACENSSPIPAPLRAFARVLLPALLCGKNSENSCGNWATTSARLTDVRYARHRRSQDQHENSHDNVRPTRRRSTDNCLRPRLFPFAIPPCPLQYSTASRTTTPTVRKPHAHLRDLRLLRPLRDMRPLVSPIQNRKSQIQNRSRPLQKNQGAQMSNMSALSALSALNNLVPSHPLKRRPTPRRGNSPAEI
jgi:hypothetical protein